MKMYRLSFYYLATGMEGKAMEFPEQEVKAESMDEAIYIYHTNNGIAHGTFLNFMSKPKDTREFATICAEI